jgi:hypothetical protein
MRQRGRGDEAVLDRHRASLCSKRRQQLGPAQSRRGLPRDALQPLYSLLEPALEPTSTATSWEQQNAETNLTQDDRVDGKLGLVAPKPIDNTLLRGGLGRLREDVRVNQITRQGDQLERVGRLGLDLHEPAIIRARPQPFDQTTVRRRRQAGEPVFIRANSVDLELLPRLNAIRSPKLRGENDLALRGDGGTHKRKIASYWPWGVSLGEGSGFTQRT